ncbi:peroxiredoxin [Neotabrizicola shimadae]|uniref:thioredoxin-dependent peroxiredoxin n=1 Tax=Neotabrizicola shimadae TaxID=2807096 RepID=A0A8G1EEJ9_9RHOB|nr:peroxiredoxin [Neotabrizicola shimadae]QYZ71398.1 peroxiredoxin [Neotabrizicola shimadae]
MTNLDISAGKPAPDFTLPRDGGGTLTLSSLRPAPVVLFAYGKDGTPTCTNEVMEFQELYPRFKAKGAEVLGLSKDKAAAHDRFIAKMGITMPLLSDHGGTMMENWGLFGEKLFFGKMVQGVLRQTVLIGGDGVIRQVWQVDKVKGHAAEVLAAVEAMA